MIHDSNIERFNNEINCIVESVKIIEDQIKTFSEFKPLFFQKKKIQEYERRIETLEFIKECLYKRLEFRIDIW